MFRTVWKHRAAIILVAMGMACFFVATRAQTIRSFAVVFVIGLLLIARPFKQAVIDNLGKWIQHLKKKRLGVFLIFC